MSQKYPGGLITKSPPATVGPVDGEGGSAPGVWTLDQATALIKQGLWPKPPLPKQLWGWGVNTYGQLGLGNTTSYSSPKQVGALTDWAVISAGSVGTAACAAIKTNGTLWTWGRNNNGGLGLGNTTNYSSPKQVGALTVWSNVSTSGEHCLALTTSGTLWAWGLNNVGQLGLGNTTYMSSPVQVGALTTWRKISTGNRNSFAIRADGTLWAWGFNSWGQLGFNNTTNYSSPKQVGALTTWAEVNGGNLHTIALRTDGTLWAWGRNNTGQLGINITYTSYSSPKQVGALTTWASVNLGTADTSAAVRTNGTLWTWGLNSFGQLGIGNTTDYSSPKQVGSLTNWSTKTIMSYYNCFAIKTDGTLWTWGWGNDGASGLGNTTNYSSPKQIGALTTWKAISSGRLGGMAIKTP